MDEFIQQFQGYLKEYPLFMAGVSLWGLGVATFFVRYIPAYLYGLIKKHLATSVTINSQDQFYYDFLEWISKNYMGTRIRTLNFNSGNRGFGQKLIVSLGYGFTYIFFKKSLVLINKIEIEANQTEYTKERIILTTLGRSHKAIHAIFKAVKESSISDRSKTSIYQWRQGSWIKSSRQSKRSLDTVVLPKSTKDEVVGHLKDFWAKKEWFIKNGVPYRTGVLLYGPPGTGKTSLVRALCAEFDKDLYNLKITGLSDTEFEHALSSIPENSIVLLEDIDCINSTHKRKISKSEPGLLTILGLSLAGLLNSLDGITGSEGRVIISTTNHKDKLDSALLREGRFNLKLKLDYLTLDCFKEYILRFYPNYKFDESFVLKDNLALCKVQSLIFNNKSVAEIIEECLAPTHNQYEDHLIRESI